MLTPYENIIIGNFLYSLGLAMGRSPRPVEACINLTQQTPLDQVLGDVMLQFPGAWRLIEFKRPGASLAKEDTKLQSFIGAARDPSVLKTSLLTHWFVGSGDEQRRSDGAQAIEPIRVRPYLKMHDTGGIGMDAFAESIVREAHGRSLSDDQLDLYMRIIQAFGVIKGCTAGLLVGIDTSSTSGGLYYLPLENIADLRATSQVLLERQEKQLDQAKQQQAALDSARQQIRELEIERDATYERSKVKQRSADLSL